MARESDVPFIVTVRRAGSLAKLLTMELIMVFFLAAAYAEMCSRFGAHGCPADLDAVSWQTFPLLAVGLYGFYWVFLKRIFFAKVIVDETVGGPFPFSVLTTHPSYVVIDLITVGFAWIVRYAASSVEVGECVNTHGWLLGNFAFPLACTIPIARLVCWYVLGQRSWQRLQVHERDSAWKPVAFFCGVLIPPMAVGTHWVMRDRLADEHWPLADETTLAGGLAAHPDYDDMVWKVRGKIKWNTYRAATATVLPVVLRGR